MTAMTVLYARQTGHPLGALTTTVPGEPPSLDPSATLQLPVPVTGNGPPFLTVNGSDLAIAALDADFTDPLDVFGWRVVTTPGPDGQPRSRLDRLATASITAERAGTQLTLTVPRLGNTERLAYEVRNEDGLIAGGALLFAPADDAKEVKLPVPDHGRPLVLVEGYPPTIATVAAGAARAALMRIRHCAVRAIVRQPWLFDDPDALSAAVIRLAVHVLVTRLSDQLDRVGQTAPLGAVTMHVTLPAPVVLDLANEGPAGPHSRRLRSFGAEFAVHHAVSGAVRAAVERVAYEPTTRRGPRAADRGKPDGEGSGPDRAAATAGSTAGPPVPGASAFTAAPDARRLAAAVDHMLLAAARLGRLRQLLQRAGPALTAEWARLLGGAAATSGAAPAAPPGPEIHAATGRVQTTPQSRPPGASAGHGGTGAPPPGDQVTGEKPAQAITRPVSAAPEMDATVHEALAEAGKLAHAPTAMLEAATITAARRAVLPSDTRIWRALEGQLASATGESPAVRHPKAPALRSPAIAAGPPVLPGHQPAGVELQVASVLPFLLVGPLDDFGVLDAVSAALAGVSCPDLLAAFACGLARKVLPPPVVGWLQPPEVEATIAAFAGQMHVPDGTATERLGRTAAGWWPVVDEMLTAKLLQLRAAESPLVAGRSAAGLIVADADGLVPMLWDGSGEDVRRLWEDCGLPPILAEPSLASAALAGLHPAHEWVRAESLAELVALAGERPAGGRSDLAPELDTPFGLLAGVALAALAWELWARDEATHPALAIRRLGDLDGRVTLEPDRVAVRMPLGRRHADLRDRGLLRTVNEVPWLHGRRLELAGG